MYRQWIQEASYSTLIISASKLYAFSQRKVHLCGYNPSVYLKQIRRNGCTIITPELEGFRRPNWAQIEADLCVSNVGRYLWGIWLGLSWYFTVCAKPEKEEKGCVIWKLKTSDGTAGFFTCLSITMKRVNCLQITNTHLPWDLWRRLREAISSKN